jgi:hypothetical protein
MYALVDTDVFAEGQTDPSSCRLPDLAKWQYTALLKGINTRAHDQNQLRICNL